jgi:DNA-binding NtrC family response regulator
MGGSELAKTVVCRHPGARVLLISGYLDQGGFQTSSPELSFLQKPFTSEQLLEKVRAILGTESR